MSAWLLSRTTQTLPLQLLDHLLLPLTTGLAVGGVYLIIVSTVGLWAGTRQGRLATSMVRISVWVEHDDSVSYISVDAAGVPDACGRVCADSDVPGASAVSPGTADSKLTADG